LLNRGRYDCRMSQRLQPSKPLLLLRAKPSARTFEFNEQDAAVRCEDRTIGEPVLPVDPQFEGATAHCVGIVNEILLNLCFGHQAQDSQTNPVCSPSSEAPSQPRQMRRAQM